MVLYPPRREYGGAGFASHLITGDVAFACPIQGVHHHLADSDASVEHCRTGVGS